MDGQRRRANLGAAESAEAVERLDAIEFAQSLLGGFARRSLAPDRRQRRPRLGKSARRREQAD